MPHNPRSNRRPSCSSRTIRSSSTKTIGDTLKADSAMRLTSRAPRSGWSAGPENAVEPSGDGGRPAGPWVSAGIAAHRAAGRPGADGPGYPRYWQGEPRDGQRVPRHAVCVAGLLARHDFRSGDDVVAQGAAGVSRIWTYHPDVCGVPSSREFSPADLRDRTPGDRQTGGVMTVHAVRRA